MMTMTTIPPPPPPPTTVPLRSIRKSNTVFTDPTLISLWPTLVHIKGSHSVFARTVCAKYCIYPGCRRQTRNVHLADTDRCKGVSQVTAMCLDTALLVQKLNRQFDTWSWNICGNSSKYTSFKVSSLYVQNRNAKLWKVSGWTAGCHIVVFKDCTVLWCDSVQSGYRCTGCRYMWHNKGTCSCNVWASSSSGWPVKFQSPAHDAMCAPWPIPWIRVLLEKLTAPHLTKKFLTFYGTGSSIPCLQLPAVCPYPEAV